MQELQFILQEHYMAINQNYYNEREFRNTEISVDENSGSLIVMAIVFSLFFLLWWMSGLKINMEETLPPPILTTNPVSELQVARYETINWNGV